VDRQEERVRGAYTCRFCGGKAPETVRLDDNAVATTREMLESGNVVAAISRAAQLLISANVLKDRKATCYKGVGDDLKAAGADYQDREVVVDPNLITGRAFPPTSPLSLVRYFVH